MIVRVWCYEYCVTGSHSGAPDNVGTFHDIARIKESRRWGSICEAGDYVKD